MWIKLITVIIIHNKFHGIWIRIIILLLGPYPIHPLDCQWIMNQVAEEFLKILSKMIKGQTKVLHKELEAKIQIFVRRKYQFKWIN